MISNGTERVHIKLEGRDRSDLELPFKILVLGDFSARSDPTPVAELLPTRVDASTLADVMAHREVSISVRVPDKLSPESDMERTVELKFQAIEDFDPERIANQVPELGRVLDLRAALAELRAAIAAAPELNRRWREILADPERRSRLRRELGLESASSALPGLPGGAAEDRQ